MSFLLPAAEPLPLEAIPLLAGIAAFDAAATICGDTGLSIKFPNDILLNGAKVAGVLVEQWDGFGAPVYVVGIGINVAAAPELDTGQFAGALVAPGAAVSSRNVAEHVITTVDGYLDKSAVVAMLVDAWNARHAGGYWRNHSSFGKVSIVRLAGLGHLVVLLPDGTERSVSAASLMMDVAL
jgi:BirA family biotin operon repressor/biotin-[acetyl-CoA-carboxylase] ligase